ncbi:hypothetical protein BC834DRAFT_489400 [Gloeopeniophorella convolvens]|nr:hypothetical protein BC834DRAFT_489400 [Gloeopeniophorella convolvens]
MNGSNNTTNLAPTLGAILCAAILNAYMYGIVAHQCCCYWYRKFNDSQKVKALIATLFILHTLHTIELFSGIWIYCITNFGNPKLFQKGVWPYTFSPVLVSVAFFLTNLFMAFRLFGLTKRKRELILIVLLATASLALGVSVASHAWVIKLRPAHHKTVSAYSAVVISWHALQSGTAVIINALLTRALFKSRSGFLRSDTVIRHLVRGAVQTGLLATICSIASTIAWVVGPNTSLYSIPGQNVAIFHTSACHTPPIA